MTTKLKETREAWITVQRNRRTERVSHNAACRRLNNPEAFWESAEEREAAERALATLGLKQFTPAAFMKNNEGDWVFIGSPLKGEAEKKAELSILTYQGPAELAPSLATINGLVYKCTPVRFFSEDIVIKLTRQAAEHAARIIDAEAAVTEKAEKEKKAAEEKKAREEKKAEEKKAREEKKAERAKKAEEKKAEREKKAAEEKKAREEKKAEKARELLNGLNEEQIKAILATVNGTAAEEKKAEEPAA